MFNKQFLVVIVLLGVVIVLLGFYWLVFWSPTVPLLFDCFFGDDLMKTTTNNITNSTNANVTALAVMKWEKDYFFQPVFLC